MKYRERDRQGGRGGGRGSKRGLEGKRGKRDMEEKGRARDGDRESDV